MKSYATLIDALEDLKNQGYTLDFNLKENYIECTTSGKQLPPDEFEITGVYRFEGMTNPSDQTVLYAVEGKDGTKGTIVSGYGIYADPISSELVKKLNIHH
ncbi:MAG: phosphoribosylpyrophosphate synthetase [Chitinophagales bacterium]